jgi:hypothetical protein
MRKTPLVLVAAAFGIVASPAFAAPASQTFNAEATILEQIAIANPTPLSFGSIDRPGATFSSQDFTVSPAGASTVGAGDGKFVVDGSAGSLSVTGSDSLLADVTAAANGACSGGSGVSLTAVTLGGTNPYTLDATIPVGGTVSVTNTASAATFTCSYTVTASYQ